jgi:hypothetical protein
MERAALEAIKHADSASTEISKGFVQYLSLIDEARFTSHLCRTMPIVEFFQMGDARALSLFNVRTTGRTHAHTESFARAPSLRVLTVFSASQRCRSSKPTAW